MFELSGKQKKKIKEICGNFGIKILLLFGSRAENQVHPESDYDFAYAGPKLSFNEAARFNADLQTIFGAAKVETVDIFSASPLLKKKIFDAYIPLFVKDKFLLHQLQSYAVKSYLETKFLREYLDEYLRKKYVRH